ncbi:hypothetical protein F5X99DRAFT_413749 [Biscogniauxia marginata]|nr:hypothetical protein F5X99DRAFT_413749 [Biscogniauxia marginata]
MNHTYTLVDVQWSTAQREEKTFYGWINFDRHLFIVRDLYYKLRLQQQLFGQGMLVPQVQCRIINSKDYCIPVHAYRIDLSKLMSAIERSEPHMKYPLVRNWRLIETM